jgi:hypothetical protein
MLRGHSHADTPSMAYDDEQGSRRRRYRRHPGTFDAWRIGVTREPLKVMNLNLGGCLVLESSSRGFVETFHLQIDLGAEGCLEVSAMTMYHTDDATAVTFINLNPQALGQIQRTVAASSAP